MTFERKGEKVPLFMDFEFDSTTFFPTVSFSCWSRSFKHPFVNRHLISLIFQPSAQYYRLHMDTSNNTQGLWHKRLAVWYSSVF